MMGALTFLKRYWNIILAFALGFVTLMSKAIYPPKIDISSSLASSNIPVLSKLLLAVITLVLIYPMYKYRDRAHTSKWWIAALMLLVLSVFQFFHYQQVFSDSTATDRINERTVVKGVSVMPTAKRVYDSLQTAHASASLTNSVMLEEYSDDPTDIWFPEEIQDNTLRLTWYYLALLVSVYLLVLCAAQAGYCYKNVIVAAG
jgi:hypothetical protein